MLGMCARMRHASSIQFIEDKLGCNAFVRLFPVEFVIVLAMGRSKSSGKSGRSGWKKYNSQRTEQRHAIRAERALDEQIAERTRRTQTGLCLLRKAMAYAKPATRT
jgi:hypothetical protein